jgi:hypothetical protein
VSLRVPIIVHIRWFKMIVSKYGNHVRKFMWQRCGWGRVVICMTFHKRAFNFFDIITHWFDSFQNCATMNCQRNINSTLPTQFPHGFSYIVAILGHNHFESPNTSYYSKVRVSNMVMTLRAVLYIIIWSNTEQSTII